MAMLIAIILSIPTIGRLTAISSKRVIPIPGIILVVISIVMVISTPTIGRHFGIISSRARWLTVCWGGRGRRFNISIVFEISPLGLSGLRYALRHSIFDSIFDNKSISFIRS